MHREGNLIDRAASRENLRQAFALARKGHHQRRHMTFGIGELEQWLQQLSREIRNGSVEVGEFHSFVIHDPKRRVIHAAPFRERVLHHALMRVAGPVFERRSIADSYACRPGKGVHRARARAQQYARRFRYCLKLDVRHYFDSVSHELVLVQLSSCFKDQGFLWLMERILRSYECSSGRGLPIGSLVSQYLANGYLGPLDRFIKEQLRTEGYVRYMDDMVLWSNNAPSLRDALGAIEHFVSEQLRLTLKPSTGVIATGEGLPFLGTRVTPWAIYASGRTRRRMAMRVRDYERAYNQNRLSAGELQRRVCAVIAAVESMRCRDYRRRLFAESQVDA
jgi:RNA-directed DNA polymerase